MVDAAAIRISRAFRFHYLFDLGRVSGSALLARSKRCRLSFAVLFARNFRQLAAREFWWETWLVARVALLPSRSFCSLGPSRLSPHVLLLPWCLLQSVLG